MPLAADEDEVINAIEINFGEYIPEENALGTITIYIPDGFVTIGGLPAEYFEIFYQVNAVLDEAADIVLDDDVVYITGPGDLAGRDIFCMDEAYVSDSEGNVIYLSYESPFDDEEGVADVSDIMEDWDFIGILVRLGNLDLEDGAYTLCIPAGYVEISSEDYSESWVNKEITWNFEVEDGTITGATSGIGSIGTAVPAIEGVYNLQGVKMGNDLNTLAPGLYIINGKKVLIRK